MVLGLLGILGPGLESFRSLGVLKRIGIGIYMGFRLVLVLGHRSFQEGSSDFGEFWGFELTLRVHVPN